MRATFHFVTAFLAHALRQHPNVPHERNPGRDDRLNLWNVTDTALEFHCLRPRFREQARGLNGLLGSVVAVNRHVRDNQSAFHPAGDGASVMQHFVQRHLGRVFVSQHHHPKGIADQDNIEAAFIEQTRGRIIVGGQRGDALSAPLHFAKFFCRVHLHK